MDFNLYRFIQLTKNELMTKGRIILLVLIISFFILTYYFVNNQNSILTNLSNAFGSSAIGQNGFLTNADRKFHLNWFPYFYLIVCSILTSLSFSEYNSDDGAQFHLSLPSTNLEKFFSKAFLTIIALPTIVFLLYIIFSIFTRKLNPGQIQLGFFDPYLWKNIIEVVLIQSFILFGALTFKKFSLFKIIFAFIGLYIFFNLVQIISFVVINNQVDLFINGGTPGLNSLSEIISNAGYYFSKTKSMSEFLGLSQMSFLISCSLISVLVSFYKFRELES